MKKLLPLLFLIILTSCDKDKTAPIPYPDPAVLAKHQAPFGTPAVDVKLKKVLYNGNLLAEYIYEGDLLLEQKKFLLFQTPKHYQSGKFKRNGTLTASYEVVSADWDAETEHVSEVFNPYYSIEFLVPTDDSLQNVQEENLVFLENFYRLYAFDKQGFITRQEFTEKTNPTNDFKITYIRNEQHNASEIWVKFASDATISDHVQYMYDTHPNPFFKLGIDRNGQLAAHSVSPNNIMRETFIEAGKPLYSLNYAYEYASNGYPSKVIVSSESSATPLYTLEFVY